MPDSNKIFVNQTVDESLREIFDNLQISNYETKFSPGTESGGNFLGLILRVEVRGFNKCDEEVYFDLIVKIAPSGEGFRSFLPVNEVYDRESFVYGTLFKEFGKLQEERLNFQPFKAFPKLYSSSSNLNNEILVMDNMKQFGFVNLDRRQPLDYDTTLFIIKELGKLHALSFALKDQKPDLFSDLSRNMDDVYFNKPIDSELHKTIRVAGNKALKSLDPIKHKGAYEKFQKYLKNMTEIALKAVDSKSAGKYAIFTHGDLWINNLLFKYKNPEKLDVLTEICILDWQFARLGSPALDLSYFMFLCTDSNLREKHYDTLIQEYHNSLSSLLIELGSNPKRLFPFKALQNQLKEFSVYGLYMGAWVLSVLTSEADEIPNMNDLNQTKEVSKKFQYESRNIEKYYSRIRDCILHMDKYDYNF